MDEHYRIVYGITFLELETKVNLCIEQEWFPHGSPSHDGHSYIQAMVSREIAVGEPDSVTPAGKRKHYLPKGFALSPALRKYAAEKTPYLNVDNEFEQFCEKSVSTGRKCADWNRAFQHWLLKSKEWKEERHKKPDIDQSDLVNYP